MTNFRPLIAGAGPVGLGAAVYLAQAGIPARIIEAREKPTSESRALAINPRTLEILDQTGATAKLLSTGKRIRGVRFARRDGPAQELLFEGQLHHKYPFILALSQASTERLLVETLEKSGRKVERGVELIGCGNKDGNVFAKLKNRADGSRETVHAPWLLAADGAHSTVRKALNLEFPGNSFERPWFLADQPLSTPFEQDMGHVFFLGGDKFAFFLRVIDDARAAQDPIWRVICPDESCMDEITDVKPLGPPIWKSSFHISHRINQQFRVGNIFFAGDAAHVLSPIGARGMNLGLEDVFIFSRLVRSNQLQRYETVRKSVDAGVVRRIELMSRVMSGERWSTRLIRFALLSWLLNIPLFRHQFLKTVTGLDHSLRL